MLYRKLDENGDMCFGAGKSDFLVDKDAVAQAINTKLNLLEGEWWEDISEGTPMFQSILGAAATDESRQAVDILLKDRIISVPNISTINNFVSSIDSISRKYTATIDIITTYGVISYSTTI